MKKICVHCKEENETIHKLLHLALHGICDNILLLGMDGYESQKQNMDTMANTHLI